MVPGILLLTELYPPAIGGSAVLFENIYSRIASCDVTVVTAPNDRRVSKIGRVRFCHSPINGTYRGIRHGCELAQHVRLASHVLRENRRRPVLVHAGRALPEGLAAFLASLVPGGPSYLSWVHGEEIASALLSREYRYLLRLVWARADSIVANSENTAGFLRASGAPAGKIHVVYPGVDTRTFSPTAANSDLRRRLLGDRQFLMLSVGRLQARKGHDLVLRALSRLHGTLSFRYVIVGDGEERGRLVRMAEQLGVSDIALFLGNVGAGDLPCLYAASDLFVLPNRLEGTDFEGFGLVFLEAAAAGIAVIAGRSGGVPEAVADGQTGVIVSGEDPDELARVVHRLLTDPALRQRFGKEGRARAERQFAWPVAVDRLLRVHELSAS